MPPPFSKHRLHTLCFGLLLAIAPNLRGLTVTDGPHVTPGETTATIAWKTDVEAGTRVQYGTQENLLNQRATGGGVGVEHRIELVSLQPATSYYFSIGSARVLLGQGSFQTLGKSTAVNAPKSSLSGAVKRFLSGIVPTPKTTPSSAASELKPPATAQTWRQLNTLADHYERHGADFQSQSQDHYAAQAWQFLQHARANALPMKWDAADGTLRVWDPKTRTFAAYDVRGRTRTFFKPSNPDYWNRQPGRPVKPIELPFR